jgi:hypothetical protein
MSDTVISSLPTISGSGIFSVTNVVPTASGGLFEPMANNDSTSYSYPLMDPAKLIGTAGQPYMNVALPAYITTLYANTYKINDNLKNTISTAAVDNREYPTSYAVQQYVQSQVSGTQIINGTGANNTYTVNTTTVNTIITTANSAAQGFTYTGGDGAPANIALYWMDVSANAPRNGASKTVMFSAPNYLKDSNGVVTHDLAFLYAGNGSNFVHMGVNYKFYQFVIRGDFLDFIQSYTVTDGVGSWEWIVKDSLGVFSNTITVGTNGTGTISDIAEANMPNPTGVYGYA